MEPASLVDWIESRDLPATLLTVAAAVLVVDLVWASLDRAKPDATNENAVKAHSQRSRTRVIAGGVAGTIVLIVLLVWAPWWIEGHHLRDDKGQLVSSAGIIITGFRTMVIAIAAGGFTAAGLYYTREKHQLEREQFQHAQEQFAENQAQFETTLRETQERDQRQAELTREGQVTGRYVEAIKLLASDKLPEVLGGIYSLERILKDSPKDHATIVEVLSAFVRSNLIYWREKERDSTPVQHSSEQGVTVFVERAELPEDTKSALNVLTRRPDDMRQKYPTDLTGAQLSHHRLNDWDWKWVDLTSADLEGAILNRTCMAGAQLSHAKLARAQLYDCDLRGANLRYVDLAAANLQLADLTTAELMGVNLEDASLHSARLDGAKCRYARMSHADLSGAVLAGADLMGSELIGATLQGTKFEGAFLGNCDLTGVDLYATTGLTSETLLTSKLSPLTRLPHDLAFDPGLQTRIQDLAAQAEADRAAALEGNDTD
ncbi:pentapeptide repeat-containing protein [Streptomyces sp. NPDC060187]|uniref:pentapeptide repeat-containing protein n=1 Tax=Streptomyces sp. NPDC060187 TaxID=3347067 RepID=UPI00364AC66E